MPTCTITSGNIAACLEGNPGGIELFLANFADLQDQVTIDPNTGVVTALPEVTLYRYEGTRNSVSAVNAPVSNLDNASLYFTHTCTIKIAGQNAARHLEILGNVARARMVIFARLASQKIIMLGYETGMYLDPASTAGSGLAKGDFDGYELTFTAEEPNPGRFLAQFTTEPFDNFADVTLDPPYGVVS